MNGQKRAVSLAWLFTGEPGALEQRGHSETIWGHQKYFSEIRETLILAASRVLCLLIKPFGKN